MKEQGDIIQKTFEEWKGGLQQKNIIFCEEFNIDRYKHVIALDIPPGLKKLLNDHLEILNTRLHALKAL